MYHCTAQLLIAGRGWVILPPQPSSLRGGRREGGREKERNITFVNISHISQYQIKILTLKSVINFFLINCNFFLHRIIRPQKKDNGEHHQIHETLDQDSVRICNKERTCSKEGQDYLE